MNSEQCFAILHVSEKASLEEVKKAYKLLVKQWHPDQFAGHPTKQHIAQEKLKEINVAYNGALQSLRARKKHHFTQTPSKTDSKEHPVRASDETGTPWHTFVSRLKKKISDARYYYKGKTAVDRHAHGRSTTAGRIERKKRQGERGRAVNFEEILQNSLTRRSGGTASFQDKEKIGTRRGKIKNSPQSPYLSAVGAKHRLKPRGKGRVEAIYPIRKIKSIDKIN